MGAVAGRGKRGPQVDGEECVEVLDLDVLDRSRLRVIEAMEEAEGAASSGDVGKEMLRVRSMPTFAVSQLAPVIPAFRKRHPNPRPELHLGAGPGNPLEGGMDVAIHVGPLQSSSLIAHCFTYTRWIICAAPSYIAARGRPDRPRDLSGHECLTLLPEIQGNVWTARSEDGMTQRLTVSRHVVSNQAQMLLELGRAGLGVVRLAEYHVAEDLASGRMVELFPEHQTPTVDPIYAVYESNRFLSLRVRLFLDFLDQCFSKRPGKSQPSRE